MRWRFFEAFNLSLPIPLSILEFFRGHLEAVAHFDQMGIINLSLIRVSSVVGSPGALQWGLAMLFSTGMGTSEVTGRIPELPKVELGMADWRDGLVVRVPNWLGDACMAFPALSALRSLLPANCGLFVVSPPSLASLFDALDIVDVVVPLHAAHSAWSVGDRKRVAKLSAGVGLLMNNSLRDAFYFRLARIPRLYGMAARGRSFLLNRAFPAPKGQVRHAARYLAMAMALGAPSWDGALPNTGDAKEPEIMPEEALAAINAENLLVVAPGAAYGLSKRWPGKFFNDICRRWIEERGGAVAVLGAPGEEEAAALAVKDLPLGKAFNLAGRTDIADVAHVLKASRAVVANDSGIMHLAAVLGVPGVAVFGSTDPLSTPPVSDKWKLLSAGLECSPCFKRVCPNGTYDCLNSVTPEMVWNALEANTCQV